MVQMHIGREEAFEIIVSILAIALVFTFYDSGLSVRPSVFVFSMAAAVITLGGGFVLHEMAHKYYALKFGARAMFKAWPAGLAIALALAVIPQIFHYQPIFFIAPGAVYIYAMRRISVRENGIISLAGPAMNWVVGFVFLSLAALFSGNPIVSAIALLGFRINLSLALFNLIPVFPLDGSKVLAWDWKIWLASALFTLASLMVVPAIVLG